MARETSTEAVAKTWGKDTAPCNACGAPYPKDQLVKVGNDLVHPSHVK